MKKGLCLLLIGILILCCTACDSRQILLTEGTQHSSALVDTEKIEFKLSNGPYTYTIIRTDETDTFEVTKMLTITNNASGKTMQTIAFNGNEWFTNVPLYLEDITFDGNVDLLVPFSYNASSTHFQAYVWSVEDNKFIYAPNFENFANFIIDYDNQVILSSRTASKITSYSMNCYDIDQQDFKKIRSVFWEIDVDKSKMHFVEQKFNEDGEVIAIKDCIVDRIGEIDINKADPQIADYFRPNSLWGLDDVKWKNYFYKP